MFSPTDLELSVFRTICWFAVFEYPLTRFEIWKWLLKPERAYALVEIDQILSQSDWLNERVASIDGFFSLKTSSSVYALTAERHVRFLDAKRKYQKLRRASFFFQLLPSMQAVCAVNTLSWWHTTAQSDIDLFVVTQPNKIWSTRLFLVLPFLLSGNRPRVVQKRSSNDPFCFSFFSTTNALQFESLKLNEEDYYLAFWVKSMVPIFDRGDVIKKIALLNRWADVLLPNARMRHTHQLHHSRRLFFLPIQFSVFEPFFRFVQLERLPTSLRELANRDSRVVITDEMLKFHDNDRRHFYFQQFLERFEKQI